MKNFTIFFLKLLLSSNLLMAETIPTKSHILKKSNQCLKEYKAQVCKKLVSQIETLQLLVFDQNRFKCQSSLLGIQSAIIEVYFLKNFSNEKISFMIPYVIKNC